MKPTFMSVLALYEIFSVEKVYSWISPPAGDPAWYWLVLVSVRLWLQVGFYMIIFIAGLQEIPRDLYEAAYVDGARVVVAIGERIAKRQAKQP